MMRLSARNQLKGKVKKIIEGSVNDEVVVELPGGQEIVAVITKSSVESLELDRQGCLRGDQGQQCHDSPWSGVFAVEEEGRCGIGSNACGSHSDSCLPAARAAGTKIRQSGPRRLRNHRQRSWCSPRPARPMP